MRKSQRVVPFSACTQFRQTRAHSEREDQRLIRKKYKKTEKEKHVNVYAKAIKIQVNNSDRKNPS